MFAWQLACMCHFLPLREILALTVTCKSWRSALSHDSSTDYVWKKLLMQVAEPTWIMMAGLTPSFSHAAKFRQFHTWDNIEFPLFQPPLCRQSCFSYRSLKVNDRLLEIEGRELICYVFPWRKERSDEYYEEYDSIHDTFSEDCVSSRLRGFFDHQEGEIEWAFHNERAPKNSFSLAHNLHMISGAIVKSSGSTLPSVQDVLRSHRKIRFFLFDRIQHSKSTCRACRLFSRNADGRCQDQVETKPIVMMKMYVCKPFIKLSTASQQDFFLHPHQMGDAQLKIARKANFLESQPKAKMKPRRRREDEILDFLWWSKEIAVEEEYEATVVQALKKNQQRKHCQKHWKTECICDQIDFPYSCLHSLHTKKPPELSVRTSPLATSRLP